MGTTHILHGDWQMWVMNWIPFDAAAPTPQCVCTNPSGQHCTDPPCYSYIFNYNTFEDAAFVGRERIGVEWIEDAGMGNSSMVKELDNWKEGIEDETVFEYPPAMCKGPAAGQNETIWRINCDDYGNFNGTPPPPEGLGHAISEQWKQMAEAHKLKSVVV